MFNIKRLFERAALDKMKAMMFYSESPKSHRADRKKGKTEQQLHAMRYPAKQFHHQICKAHQEFWNKRGYNLN